MALDELYQEVLLDHYKQPRNKGVLAEPDIRLELKNPFCGDEILLTLKMAEGRVAEAAFEGHGCVISQASASVMTEKIKGLRVEEDKMDIKILSIARHRNGVMGCPFYVILFKDKEFPKYTFVANVFDTSVLAVEELVKGNITFGEGNSWASERWEKIMMDKIQAYEQERYEEARKKADEEFTEKFTK